MDRYINTPLDNKTAKTLKAGDYVYIQRETQHIKEWMRHLTEMKVCQ